MDGLLNGHRGLLKGRSGLLKACSMFMLTIAVLGASKGVTVRIVIKSKNKKASRNIDLLFIEGSKLFGKPSTNINKFTQILKAFKEIPFSWDYLFTVSDTGT